MKKILMFLTLFLASITFSVNSTVYAEEVIPEENPSEEIKNITLTYDANGGSGTPEAIITTSGADIVISDVVPTKDGYKFLGWSSDSSNTVTYQSGDKVNLTADITLYAVWGLKVKVSLNANGGTVTKSYVYLYTNDNYDSLPVPTRKGYTFDGWYTAKSDGTLVNEDVVVTNEEAHTLYAKWSLTDYAITYKLNGGTNGSKNPDTYTMKTNDIILSKPTRKGYTFNGWYSDSKYKKKVTEIEKGSTGNKTLYAKWTVNKYSIVFNGNGSTSGSTKTLSNLAYNKIYTLTSNGYKRKGYTFVEWNTKKDGTGTSYSNKEKVEALSSKSGGKVTLYAQWKKVKYTIKYELKGGTNSSKNPESYYVTTKTIKLVSATRKGYTFSGWYSDSKYKKKVTEIKKGSTGSKTLYAKWTAKTYKITYDLNGGKNSSKNPSSYKITSSNITFAKPTRKGYTFVGWYTDEECTNQIELIEKGSTGNKTLYAKWEKTKYTITYNLNGGTNNDSNPEKYYITTSTIKLSNPSKSGYTFSGWYSDSKFKTKVTEIKKGSTGNKTLYAKWSVKTYKITYNLNGGTNGSNPSSYKVTSSTINLKNPTRTGYTFDGWYTDSEFNNRIESIDEGSTGNKTLYAKWIANTFTLRFEDNGADAGYDISDMQCTYGSECLLPYGTYSKDGYVFGGWNVNIDGSGKTYKEGSSVKNITSVDGDVVIFYGRWTVVTPSFELVNKKYDLVNVTLGTVPNAEGYIIYRSKKSSSDFKAIATITSGTSYNDNDVSANTTYYYKVRAYYTNEYGVRIYSDYTNTVKWKTALKPKFSAAVTNTLNAYSYRGYVTITNKGTLPLYILNFANIYPYGSASSYNAIDPAYNSLSYVSLRAGYRGTMSFKADRQLPFMSGAHVVFGIKYDGCEYVVTAYEDGSAYYI